ncbi:MULTISPECIES: ParB/RepB/Spo0J family partition protein [unclassified Sphingopyxis]|jgi:ParB family transcriptional regulator, chromosome partitioning protein|uniref:ParB/RepB/Spo0J family partition protein n=1 Tax=unclassified Sphingopyxis TaxID=2614943 RepID=UPI0028659880|nr:MULTISPECIES: ParB/RepB/Spo0J family partition protein [unclassified Sphingopyxis]MDR6833295.1 ParB family chromosome partitioning protein [Sphingopyxis sp. BE122]MDR7225564.1 ParB family chromosome partitioning protein [Sphingopyxis sp. BE259]
MTDNKDESGASPARKRPSGLGRGLNALFGDVAAEAPVLASAGSAAKAAPTVSGDAVQHVPVGAIRPLPGQPRRHFDENAIAELADSIGLRGLLQPIIVRRAPDGDGYQLVAGERRWRAAQRAGLHQIPALVRELDDAATYEIALVENIQRQDLNAIEEAGAYRRLIDDFGHNHEALAKLVGKSRSHVANLMRLLDLPQAVQALVGDGSLAMGHARALIGAADAESIARRVVKDGLSVRAVEALVREDKGGGRKAPLEYKSMDGVGRDPDIVAVERHLSELLGIGVAIHYSGGGKGALTLKFASLDQLDMICQRLSGEGI